MMLNTTIGKGKVLKIRGKQPKKIAITQSSTISSSNVGGKNPSVVEKSLVKDELQSSTTSKQSNQMTIKHGRAMGSPKLVNKKPALVEKSSVQNKLPLKTKSEQSNQITVTRDPAKILSKHTNKNAPVVQKPFVKSSPVNKEIVKSNEKPDAPKVNVKRKHKKDKQNVQVTSTTTEEEADNSSKHPRKLNPLFNESPKQLNVSTQSGKSFSEKVFAETGNKFCDLDIHKHLVSNLEKINFTTLTTVQEKAIPVILTRQDVLIRSQTGSGKTLSYAVPIMNALQGVTPRLKRSDGVQAIVVVPTRELALQTIELFNKINTFQWIVCTHLCGGENRQAEKKRIKKGLHVLIGTPGRLLDHVLHTSSIKIDNVQYLVLDEADRLLDMGFRKDIISLVEALSNAKSSHGYDPLSHFKAAQNNATVEDPTVSTEFSLGKVEGGNRQTILLSATLTEGVSELANFAMKDHVFIDAFDNLNTSDNLIIPDTVKQEFIVTNVKHRLFTLSALIVAQTKKQSKMFVFMASTDMVNYHYDLFNQCLVKMPVSRGKLKTGNVVLYDVGVINSDEDDEEEEEIVVHTKFFKLHGNMNHATRKEVFNSFRAAKTGVLLCTDVAARGIDVPSADCIVQYTGPQTDQDYLHRVGRVGRVGKHGSAIIFLTYEEQEYITQLAGLGVYLKQRATESILQNLCKIMQESEHERAAEALQRRYETVVAKNKALYYSGCKAYTTWSRFYNSYPVKMRAIFDFKNVNLGHYATSFALRDTPSQISQAVRNQLGNEEDPKLNRKLANHTEDDEIQKNKFKHHQKTKKRPLNLTTSEFSSGLEPAKKKKKIN